MRLRGNVIQYALQTKATWINIVQYRMQSWGTQKDQDEDLCTGTAFLQLHITYFSALPEHSQLNDHSPVERCTPVQSYHQHEIFHVLHSPSFIRPYKCCFGSSSRPSNPISSRYVFMCVSMIENVLEVSLYRNIILCIYHYSYVKVSLKHFNFFTVLLSI